ncbi:MAG TPA: ABC transporter ATP-binding protein [Candidatus Krumholzibacteria bacterium]|nr:ABC transporter ATP-binding protein [Candidatus Krumholzibacteria bacterium]HPD72084.1 ABC transporter ATP-binding protein [Candidatus Krumholzibacteria bacterium]HRY40984.1 ABC transporter ATP-binding protein [Candidatus Krumholzibacteria bacterium]
MIEVRNLTRHYGTILALDDVSFHVAQGEIAGFLGPNGAGKSTCLKILTGSLAPGAGGARVGGLDVVADPLAARRHVGFLPENVPLYPEGTVRELLRFVADLKHVPRAGRDAQLDDIMARCGLDGMADRLVGHLSKGYRQRTGLAQALVGDPPVLVLDEPTSGLDPHQIVEIRELIRGFRGHKTVLLSSHLLAEVSQVCERVLILDRGRLVCEERAENLKDQDGASTIVLTWEGNREEVARALTEVAGEGAVRLTAQGAEIAIAGSAVEIKPRLVESVLRAGGRLQGLEDRGPTLEDLFLRLTGAAPAEPGAAGERPAPPEVQP